MTTSHELARKLLSAPDLPVVLSIYSRRRDDAIEAKAERGVDVDEAIIGKDDVILLTGCDK